MDSWIWFTWGILFGIVFCSVVLFFGAIPDAKEIIVYEKVPTIETIEVETLVYVGEYPDWFVDADSIDQSRIIQEVKRVYDNRRPQGVEDE